MIALTAKIGVKFDREVNLVSALSNISDDNGNCSLDGVINKVADVPFVSSILSDEEGKFPKQQSRWLPAERMTYQPNGWTIYNGIRTFKYTVAYIFDLKKYMANPSYAEVEEIQISNAILYEYSTNYNSGNTSIGLLVDLYYPLDVIASFEESGIEFIDVIPTVKGKIVFSSNENSDTEIVIDTDKPTTTLSFVFDKETGRHPNTIIIDGNSYIVNSPYFKTDFLPISTTHTVKIDNWNTPNSPIVIYGISSEFVDWTKIDYRQIISLNRPLDCRSDIKKPSYGIISNKVSIEFKDIYSVIPYFAEKLILTENLPVNIYLNNRPFKTAYAIGEFYTENWDYDNNNGTVSLSLKDNLEEWQDIWIEGFSYDSRNPKKVLPNQNMADLYKWLHEKTPAKYKMLAYNELNYVTRGRLERTKIEYPFLESGTLWQQWLKICQVCALYIYVNEFGRTDCQYTVGS